MAGAGDRNKLKRWRGLSLALLVSPSLTLRRLSSAFAVYFLRTLPSCDIGGCSLRMGWEKRQTTQTSGGNQGLNLSVNLRSESGNESAFSCACAAKQPVLGGKGGFEVSFTVCPLHFPNTQHHTRAHTHAPHPQGVPIPSQSLRLGASGGLQLATVPSQAESRKLGTGLSGRLPSGPTQQPHPPPPSLGYLRALIPRTALG